VVDVTVSPDKVSVGSVVSMIVVVTNEDPDAATNVTITLPLPAGTTPQLPNAAYNSSISSWQWTQSSIAAHGSVTVTASAVLSQAPTSRAVVVRASAIAAGLQVPTVKTGGALLAQVQAVPATVAFTPGSPTVLNSPDGRVQVTVPSDAASQALTFQFSYTPDIGAVTPPAVPAFKRGFSTFYLKATALDGTRVTTFARPLKVRATYTTEELQALGIPEGDLTLFWFDETPSAERWVPLATLPNLTVAGNPLQHAASASVSHLSPFQLSDGSSPSAAFVPSLQGWQVGLFTGNMSYQYPIEVPAGPGGMKPDVDLGYNSSSTDGATGERANHQSGWAGKGWSLDTGYVALNKTNNAEDKDRYYTVVFNGLSFDLQRGAAIVGNPKAYVPTHWNWRATDETFIKVRAVANGGSGRYKDGAQYDSYKWQVWSKDGTRYDFVQESWQGWINENECPDVEQTYMEAYKWQLTQAVDTHGNTITYNYGSVTESIDVTCGSHITGTVDSSVWPASILWGANTLTGAPNRYKVDFFSEDRTMDTIADRADNHAGREPHETRQLRSIKVLSNQSTGPYNAASWDLVRQYNLVYQEGVQPPDQQLYLLSDVSTSNGGTPATYTPDYASQKLTLKSLIRVGKDGTTALPAMTFEYGLVRGTGEYPNDSWNRLKKVDNGQGGVMEITHKSIGGAMSPQNRHFKNNWRVSQRVTRDGMGVGPTHEYTSTYTYGTPAFNSLGRDLSDDPPNDPSTNATPNSATLYFNKYWDTAHSNENVLIHKARKEFRGHDKVVEHDSNGNETEHYFYQGDDPCGTPKNAQGEPEEYDSITSNACFQAIRKSEFLKGKEYKTISYQGAAGPSGTKLSGVERTFVLPIIDPLIITDANALASLPGLWRSFSYESLTTENAWDGASTPITKATSVVYETTYGNLTEVREQFSSTVRLTTHSYVTKDDPLTNTYIVDRTRADNIFNGQGQWLARTVYGYDGSNGAATLVTTGELTLVRKFYDLPVPASATLPTLIHSSDTRFTYDGYGNPKTTTTYSDYGVSQSNGTNWGAPGANSNAITSTTSYETVFNVFPTSFVQPAVNSVVLSESANYDYRMGSMTSVTDTNSIATRAEYDLFGRMVKLIKPGDTSLLPTVESTYFDNTRPFSYTTALREVSGNSAYRPTIQYYDGLGRKVQTKSESQDGTQHIVADSVYDGLGHVLKQSQPRYVANAAGNSAFWNYVPVDTDAVMRWTLTQYDGLGRTTRVTASDTTSSTVAYGQGTNTRTNSMMSQVVTTDANLHKTAHLSDMFGRLSQVKEFLADGTPYAYTNYEYSPLDLLEKVIDANGKQTTMQYDSLGRKTYMNDLTMGAWAYEYNPSGTLKTQSDSMTTTQTTAFAYDVLGRLTVRSYDDGSSVEYGYDDTTGGNKGKGQLTLAQRYSAANAITSKMEYRYDQRGQRTSTVYTRPALTTTISQTYDAAGRVTSLTYPGSGEIVSYAYDSAWRQTSVCSNMYSGLCYARAAQYTALNQSTLYELGNGLLQGFNYSNPMQRLSQVLVGTLFNRTYSYDPVGNVRTIGSSGQGTTTEAQTFAYDSLDRLGSWQLQAGTTVTKTYAYDVVGNIVNKEGVANTYDYNHTSGAGGPYAVRNSGYSYDSNGNMLTGAGRTYVWNQDNQPTSINSNFITELYTYDADGERIQRIRNIVTHYIGGVYEQDGTDPQNNTKRYYYSLGGQVIAQREVVTAIPFVEPCDPEKEGCTTPVPPTPVTTNTIIYLHGDHLGSVSMSTSAAGTVVSRQEFDPWGKVRTGGVTQTKLNYTGQQKDDTGLLYYHARYYDPNLARFVSPDSIVPGVASGKGGAGGNTGIWQTSRLAVDFHEKGYVAFVRQENQLTLQSGFWFQLAPEDRQGGITWWGPRNPQALNRYSYVLGNPLRYVDPTGHGGEVINNSSVAIIIIGTNPERVEVLAPGESSRNLKPPMEDVDYWRTIDGDPNLWDKIGDDTRATIVDDGNNRPNGVKASYDCTGFFGCGNLHEQVCGGPIGPYGKCPNSHPGQSADGRYLPGIITSGDYMTQLQTDPKLKGKYFAYLAAAAARRYRFEHRNNVGIGPK
jgi:RHS repeat-associated protein/uncharacterized repeat protein (TIGR01451 family)